MTGSRRLATAWGDQAQAVYAPIPIHALPGRRRGLRICDRAAELAKQPAALG